MIKWHKRICGKGNAMSGGVKVDDDWCFTATFVHMVG